MQAIRFLITAAALLLFLQACAPVTPKPARPSPEIEAGMAQAAALLAGGDPLGAAAKYQELAQQARPPVREDLLLRAADALLQAGDVAAAGTLLAGIDERSVPAEYRLRRQLLQAQAALAQGQDEQALALLRAPLPAATPLELRRSYHELRAQAYLSSARPLQSAQELAELNYWLDDPEQKLTGQLGIVERLTLVPAQDLKALQPSPPNDFAGWMELAAILQEARSDPQGTAPRIWAWRASFPNHPALTELPDTWFAHLRARSYRPRQIAVLLPETGRFQRVAAALREGILAAYFSQPPDQRPELRFFDSSDGANTWPLLQQAVSEGAELILGPLDKDAVSQLLRAGELPVPVLALNQVTPELGSPQTLYQFGLTPEDEAAQVAERAREQGFSRALVLTPDDEWGERLYQGFRERWEALGGRVVERSGYDPREHDFSSTLRSLLNLDESEERRQQMQRLLARNLNFEPRRRRDAEFVFLAARPQQGRAIRPQLQFHHAEDLPVLATSHIYTGQHSIADRDLEGVSFPDSPWLFGDSRGIDPSREQLAAALPGYDDRFARLTAMGIDSYNLIAVLPRLKANPRETLAGATGTLAVDASNLVRRRMVWAQFHDGVPRYLYTPEPLTEQTPSEGTTEFTDSPPAPGEEPQTPAAVPYSR
jgi:outer membrane PBP1 activator LpoA protein